MHIAVVAEMVLGSRKAHAINVVKTAGGFLRLGHRVVLLCNAPSDRRQLRQLLGSYAEPRLEVVAPPGSAPESDGPEASSRFGRWAAEAASEMAADAVYARHFLGAIACARRGLPTAMETHAHVGDRRAILRESLSNTREPGGIDAVITISKVLRDYYISLGVAPDRVRVVPDGVDLDMFQGTPAGSAFDESSGPNVVYCGHLYDYKGIPSILDASGTTPDVTYHLVGGTEEDVARVRAIVHARALRNVRVHGSVPHADVPRFLCHADVLLLPPSAHDPSARWTSPVKLGEYLAAGPPIVATAIPGLLAWVSAPAVRWCPPDEPGCLAEAVMRCLFESPEHRAQRRLAAATFADQFSYPRRAESILQALSKPALDSSQLAA